MKRFFFALVLCFAIKSAFGAAIIQSSYTTNSTAAADAHVRSLFSTATNIVDRTDLVIGTLYTNTSGSNLTVYCSVAFSGGSTANVSFTVDGALLQVQAATSGLDLIVGGFVGPGSTYQLVKTGLGTVAIVGSTSARVYSPLGGASGGTAANVKLIDTPQVLTTSNVWNKTQWMVDTNDGSDSYGYGAINIKYGTDQRHTYIGGLGIFVAGTNNLDENPLNNSLIGIFNTGSSGTYQTLQGKNTVGNTTFSVRGDTGQASFSSGSVAIDGLGNISAAGTNTAAAFVGALSMPQTNVFFYNATVVPGWTNITATTANLTTNFQFITLSNSAATVAFLPTNVPANLLPFYLTISEKHATGAVTVSNITGTVDGVLNYWPLGGMGTHTNTLTVYTVDGNNWCF
jgi:hypothetical protein